MLDIFKKFSYLLERREKTQVVGLFFLLLIGSALEMLGVGFVVPFISLVSQPDVIQEQPLLNTIYTWLGSPSPTQFLALMCLIYVVIYAGKNVYVAGMYYLQYRFIFNKQRKLADKLLKGYLGAPYTFHLQRNTAVLIRNLIEETNQLFMGLDTVVGERGVRLSGGQRQRVGIARALYHNPQVLVMDEATAALDNETEAGIMEAVEKLSGEKTLIMIAHRLTTVKNCDSLYLMERGKVVDQGSYEELRDRNESFMRMAKIS